MNPRVRHGAGNGRGGDHPLPGFHRCRRVAGCDQTLDLGQRRRRIGADGLGLAEEEVQRLVGPLGDQPQRFDRRLRLAGLHEVDGRPADVVACHLAETEAAFQACLLDAPRPYLHATPTTPAAAGDGFLLPPRAIRFGWVRKHA